jgi:hypothetical protein
VWPASSSRGQIKILALTVSIEQQPAVKRIAIRTEFPVQGQMDVEMDDMQSGISPQGSEESSPMYAGESSISLLLCPPSLDRALGPVPARALSTWPSSLFSRDSLLTPICTQGLILQRARLCTHSQSSATTWTVTILSHLRPARRVLSFEPRQTQSTVT